MDEKSEEEIKAHWTPFSSKMSWEDYQEKVKEGRGRTDESYSDLIAQREKEVRQQSSELFKKMYEGNFIPENQQAIDHDLVKVERDRRMHDMKTELDSYNRGTEIDSAVFDKWVQNFSTDQKKLLKETPKQKPNEDQLTAVQASQKQRAENLKQWSKGKTMANKFLPFIVEKSTPINIYSTLLSRSKGMNSTLIASVLYLVLSEGIVKVREAAKQLPDMELEQLYEELLVRYEKYRIDDSYLQRFTSIIPYLTEEDKQSWSPELNEYTPKDIMVFLLVMTFTKELSSVCNMFLDKLITAHDHAIMNINEYKLFSDSGQQTVVFNTPEQLKGYILYHALISRESVPPICAVLKQKEDGDADVPF